MLRCLQLGIRLPDLHRLEYGQVLDILVESGNDGCEYKQLATQEDFDRF